MFYESKEFSSSAASSDTVKLQISFKPETLSDFMTYKTNADTFETIFSLNPQTNDKVGQYFIYLTLYDEAEQETLYTILVDVREPVKNVTESEEKEVQSISTSEVIIPRVSIPSAVSYQGELTLKFSSPVLVPDDW